ncbi:PucR family transcriptional regulator [Neobacillus cucumis]|uniref:PucR family transcriptional regulator n=1 Tax=Neobacillus cucumis TaxID=1740721 RepID=A0A2N5HSM3_9BACI|nr:PucR family transcriptional regulator [Neobacillus cucumis]PLS08513.1 PucR family transcriptional regulator [Neobacillus cucumis]
MKIFELLTIPQLAGMRIIAGKAGKDREVESVNMMDAPDIIQFLNKNEFLVTTAYHLKDHPHMLSELVTAMAEQGCAGLGIKTKRFLNEVPAEVISLADQLTLPIIELPLELSLGQIVNFTFQTILDKRAAELKLVLETHKQFTNIIMQGKGIQLLLQDLSKMINRPVQLIDQHMKPISQPITELDFHSLLDGISIPPTKISPISLTTIASKQDFTLFPVHISEKKYGFLIIIGEIKKTDQFTLLTIEQAANVISFSLIKENALRQHDRSIRNDFFLHFLDGTLSSQDEITGRAAEFSLQNNQMYICAVGKIDGELHHPTYTQQHEKADDLYDFIEGELSTKKHGIHFFKKGESCILLFEVHEDRMNPGTYVESNLIELQNRVSSYFGNTISFGVSTLCQNFLQTKSAYKEAVDALSQGKLSKKKEYIQTYHTKDIMELMRQIPQEDLRNFYAFALEGFKETKIEEEQSLLETLLVYLETHCQISETAKRLFVHRNTVVYRIEKCEEILGKSLKDPETTLQIRLALRIKSLIEK